MEVQNFLLYNMMLNVKFLISNFLNFLLNQSNSEALVMVVVPSHPLRQGFESLVHLSTSKYTSTSTILD